MSIHNIFCTLGTFDIPIIQMQPPFTVDLLDSNIVLFGSAMSGKTTFIKTLINILHKRYTEKQEQIFILDFGGALSEYKAFPLVSAYFDNSNEEYVKRVFKIMDNVLKDNIKELNGKNYRDSDNQPLHTTFVIDNLNAFMDEPRYSAYQEKLAKLCRDGLSKGITVVVTAVETKGLGSYLGSFKQKIAFEMPADKYSDIFTGKVGQIGNNPGHGFANVTVKPNGITGTFRMNLPYEVQCTLPYSNKDAGGRSTEETFITNLKRKFNFSDGKYQSCVKKYQTFPKELTPGEYEKIKQIPPVGEKPTLLPVDVALDYVDFCPVTVDLGQSHVIAIYGKREFGKTNLLKMLLHGVTQQKTDVRIVFLDDGRNQLKELSAAYEKELETVYFNGFSEGSVTLSAMASKPAPPQPALARSPIARPEPTRAESPKTASRPEETRIKKLSPLQRFYLYLNDHYIDLSQKLIGDIFGLNDLESKRIASKNEYADTPFTVFVIQSKLVYLNTPENKHFIEKVLPRLAAVAEDKGYVFIFSDVQKISDMETNTVFNNSIGVAFLLDNIAEFAGERGQKTVFGSMDIKTLKEDYARCEKGDGYFYDIEADRLLKAKFIKYEED